jgi:hypothetical protein
MSACGLSPMGARRGRKVQPGAKCGLISIIDVLGAIAFTDSFADNYSERLIACGIAHF